MEPSPLSSEPELLKTALKPTEFGGLDCNTQLYLIIICRGKYYVAGSECMHRLQPELRNSDLIKIGRVVLQGEHRC